MRRNRNLNRLAYFVAVVEHGSFTGASDALDITKAVVSQQVAKLEEETGTSLLMRTTRRVAPTEAGKEFYARCLSILREAESAFDQVSHAGTNPVGLLRVATSLDFGITVVMPAATAFKRMYPDCDVSLMLEDRVVDLLAERIDLSIRVGWLADSSFTSRKIGGFRQVAVAVPEIAKQLPRGAGVEALANLPFVANSVLRNPLQWRFVRGREVRTVKTVASISANATMAVHAATLSGGGFSVLPDYLVASDLASGRLVRLLPDWQLPSGGIFLVFPTSKYRPPKTTAFVDVLTQRLGKG